MKVVRRVLESFSDHLGDAEAVVRVRNKSVELSVTTPTESWSWTSSGVAVTVVSSVLMVLLVAGGPAFVAAHVGTSSGHDSSSTKLA